MAANVPSCWAYMIEHDRNVAWQVSISSVVAIFGGFFPHNSSRDYEAGHGIHCTMFRGYQHRFVVDVQEEAFRQICHGSASKATALDDLYCVVASFHWTTALTRPKILEDVLCTCSIRLDESFEGIVVSGFLSPCFSGLSCFFLCVLCCKNRIQIFSQVT